MNTASTLRSRTRISLIAALLPLFAAPLISQADSGTAPDAAMDACISAFVSTRLEKERPYTVQKESQVTTSLDQIARTYRIALTATGKNTGKKFAKATCVVDRSGAVLSLNGKPYSSTALAQSTVLSAR